jgi:enoyl-CoA hydratase/carnithine racemase
MADNLVQHETDGNIAIITMNRSEKLNAVNHELRTGVSEALIRADDDKSIHVVILRSNGRSFIARRPHDDGEHQPTRFTLGGGTCIFGSSVVGP